MHVDDELLVALLDLDHAARADLLGDALDELADDGHVAGLVRMRLARGCFDRLRQRSTVATTRAGE